MSSSLRIEDSPELRLVIDNANRKANEPIPSSIYNAGTEMQVNGRRMNDAAGFHCELYRTMMVKISIREESFKDTVREIQRTY